MPIIQNCSPFPWHSLVLFPCIIFIHHLLPSNILFDLFIAYWLSYPPECKTHEAELFCILSMLYPSTKPEKMFKKYLLNEQVNGCANGCFLLSHWLILTPAHW